MARRTGGAIVVDVRPGDDYLEDARRLADAARSLNGASRRIGGQLRATTAGYLSAVGKSVRAVEALRDEQLAAFGATAKAWESARTRLNGLSASLAGLKQNLRDAFVPILTAAAPALTTLTDLLATAVGRVGAFMAALTGQDAFVRATGAQRAYAGSVRRTAGASRALERQLARFDELDILRKSRSGAGGSAAAAGAAADLAGQLKLIPIDEGALDFARRLKRLFEAGDFDGVGRAIADGLNGAIERARALIRWESVGADVTKAVDGFCAAFNGLVDGVRWTEVGGALGDGVDTLLRTANRLLADIRFDRVGSAIGDALNGMVAEIDFEVLGDTLSRLLTAQLVVAANAVGQFDWSAFAGALAAGFGSFIRGAAQALDGIDWADLALKLTQGLNRFIGDVDWPAVGAFLGRRLSDALVALRSAVSAFDWGAAGGALSDAVNGLVREVDWTALGQWLDRTIKGLLDFGIRFIRGFDADGFADGVRKALGEVDWDGIAGKLWTLLSEALSKLGGIGNLLGLGGASLDGMTLSGRQAEAQVGVRLVRRGWTSLDGFVGTAVTVLTRLGKSNWTTIANFVGTAVTVLTSLGKSNWSTIGSFVGTSVSVLTALVKSGWTSLSGFVGDRVTAAVSLVKSGWASVDSFVGTALSVKTSLEKWGWTSLSGFVGDSVTVRTALQRWGWSSITDFVGEFTTVRTALERWGWTSLSGFVGDSVTVRTALERWGWSSIGSFIGTSTSVKTALEKWGWSTIGGFVGEDVDVWTSLYKNGWSSIAGFVGTSVAVYTSLRKSGWTSIADYVGTAVTTKVNLVVNKANAISAKVAAALGLASGGVISAGGRVMRFAGGGAILDGGRAGWWRSVQKYADGTGRAHGTLFVAGEAGPEIVGHVNGRTEILNKSQLAQAMLGAVAAGMAQAVNALGRFLAGHMAACTNALIGSVAALRPTGVDDALARRLSAIAGSVNVAPPAAAAGSVTPYEVASQQARFGSELQGTLDANNADLIQTIISVIGAQTAAIVAAVNGLQSGGGRDGGVSAQRIIDEINRRTQMFSASPLRGV